MYILDTNHISVLERRGPEADTLLTRLAEIPVADVVVTIISYEEQVRGWMAAISRSKNSTMEVSFYRRLLEQLENYCSLTILQFDADCASQFDGLRTQHRRISTPDLKIAAIARVNDATLLTQNERDFRDIENLRVEDWTRGNF